MIPSSGPARRAACALLISLAALLASCGGGTTSDVEGGSLTPVLPELTGTVTDGQSVPGLLLEVAVKGNVGSARTASGRRGSAAGSYLASADLLSGPYLLKATSTEARDTFSVTTEPGTANITPLTTLLVAQLLGAEPSAYFSSLGGRGGFTAADDASIAAATQRVRRILQRDFGIDVPAGIGDFVTTPFQPVAGDAMFDALVALNAGLAAAGTDYLALAARVGEESARCKAESVNVTAGNLSDPFCPFSKRNEFDEGDASISLVAFSNRRGDTLGLRVRGSVVLGVQLVTADGATHACEAASCRGITLGTPAGDLTRTVTFTATTLAGPAGPVVLQGALQTAVPGVPLPGLPCTTNRYYLLHPDRSVEAYCATPDDFGLGAAGRAAPNGATRIVYTFGGDFNGEPGPTIEVVTQGDAVVRALVYGTDPVSGLQTALFQCRDGGCSGITLGPVTIDSSLGVPLELRSVTFDNAVLPAVLPDGSLSTTDSVTVKAALTGNYYNDPSVPPMLPVACAPSAPNVAVVVSDLPAAINVCVPDDTQGFPLASTSIDEAGNLYLVVQNLLADGAGSFSTGNTITVTVAGNTVASVAFDQNAGPRFECKGTACAGVVVSAPDEAGNRTVDLSGTALRELGSANLIADRTAALDGRFNAPPP